GCAWSRSCRTWWRTRSSSPRAPRASSSGLGCRMAWRSVTSAITASGSSRSTSTACSGCSSSSTAARPAPGSGWRSSSASWRSTAARRGPSRRARAGAPPCTSRCLWPRHPRNEPMASRSACILLVEDNDDHAELITRALDDHGIDGSAVRAKDGEAALEYLFGEGAEQRRPDVIFLDLRLPRVDGLEVLRRIKSAPELKAVPVVV